MSKLKVEKRQLEVRLAENQLEIEQTLALRYDIFNEELKQGLPESASNRKDRDRYDLYCDHLIVLDKTENDKIVGTYRILRKSIASKHEGFYSENEFNLDGIHDLKDELAEIGRSCVHPAYRDGSVIGQLWAGLGMYMKSFDVRYLCGCGSVHTHNSAEVSEIYAYLREKDALTQMDFQVTPLSGYEVPNFNPAFPLEDFRSIQKKIPPLIKGYIRAGSKIVGFPAYDAVFGTTDFFVTFDVKEVDKRYSRHYIENTDGFQIER